MRAQIGAFVVLALTMGLGSVTAQEKATGQGKPVATQKEKVKKTGKKAIETPPETPVEVAKEDANVSEEVAKTPETSLDACRDSQDNDGDGHADCADEDCQIYAICVGWQPPSGEPETSVGSEGEGPTEGESGEPEPEPEAVPTETGIQCRDKKDNDGDGLVDCHDDTCKRYAYCRRLMYETPMPTNKAPALYISLGAGLALPNYRTPTAKTERFAPYNRRIPFDPDIGVTAGMKIGYFFLKWLGVGANFSVTGSGATNRREGFFERDDSDLYRYYGTKIAGHVGGFVRLQWPLKRFVPFLDVALGYSVAKYTWNVYDSDTPWWVIEDTDDGDDWRNGDDSAVEYELVSRHITFALEPGFDIFVVRRVFAIGARAWLPVVASNESSTDNVGILMHLTVTPLWRGSKRLKAEYRQTEGKGRSTE